jgi:hypothetical protein
MFLYILSRKFRSFYLINATLLCYVPTFIICAFREIILIRLTFNEGFVDVTFPDAKVSYNQRFKSHFYRRMLDIPTLNN